VLRFLLRIFFLILEFESWTDLAMRILMRDDEVILARDSKEKNYFVISCIFENIIKFDFQIIFKYFLFFSIFCLFFINFFI
jgi:hypothetical protein